MGLISLDELELNILLESKTEDCESPQEKEILIQNQSDARTVLPLVHRHHQLLVTLLLLNSLANESLPLFLDSLVPSWVAIVLSVSLILVFGEIFPSAIFTGPERLRISAKLCPLVYLSMLLTSPLVYPIAKMLDYILSSPESETSRLKYSKAHILALLRLHVDNHTSGTLGLSENELRIIQGAMNLRVLTVQDVMTREIFMICENDIQLRAEEILNQCHSRIPIFGDKGRNDIRGILFTKHWKSPINPTLREPLFVDPNDSLAKVLRILSQSRSHFALVVSNPQEMKMRFENGKYKDKISISSEVKILGVVTLLDVLQLLADEHFLEDENFKLSASPTLLSLSAVERGSIRRDEWVSNVYRKHASFSAINTDLDEPLMGVSRILQNEVTELEV
jgi:metal transporter CNNM